VKSKGTPSGTKPTNCKTYVASDWPPHLVKASRVYYSMGEALCSLVAENGGTNAEITALQKHLLLAVPSGWPMPGRSPNCGPRKATCGSPKTASTKN
jgi:hypothetical protein